MIYQSIETLREKDSEGNKAVIKAYVFDEDKLKRVVEKYGYEPVTKLPSEPGSSNTQDPAAMEKIQDYNVENSPCTSTPLSYLSNLVTDKKIDR